MNIASNQYIRHVGFWLIFLLVQSVLFGGGNGLGFYLAKNVAIVSLQAIVVYTNFYLLIPNLLLKKRYLPYIGTSIIGVYLIYAISFDVIGLSFSIFFPSTTRGGSGLANWWPSDFWRILSGSVPYSLMLLASTIFQLVNGTPKEIEILSEDIDTSSPEDEDTLMLKEGKVIHRLNVDDILYVQGMKEYVSWHTADKKLITLHSLANLEETLRSKGFLRTHKSFIVNTKCVNAIRYDSLDVPGSKIPIGRSYRAQVQNCFKSHY